MRQPAGLLLLACLCCGCTAADRNPEASVLIDLTAPEQFALTGPRELLINLN